MNVYISGKLFEIRVSTHCYNDRNVANHSCLFDYFIDAKSVNDVKEKLVDVFGKTIVEDEMLDSEGYTYIRKIDLTK